MTDGPALRPFLSLEGCGFLLVIFNSATRCSPILPANIVHCCHPVHEHPAMGVPREESASSTPEACCSVYRNVTDGWRVTRSKTIFTLAKLTFRSVGTTPFQNASRCRGTPVATENTSPTRVTKMPFPKALPGRTDESVSQTSVLNPLSGARRISTVFRSVLPP